MAACILDLHRGKISVASQVTPPQIPSRSSTYGEEVAAAMPEATTPAPVVMRVELVSLPCRGAKPHKPASPPLPAIYHDAPLPLLVHN
jgi:hypothetical protein